ncbi:3D-(3,5/4)-trihydroxycyclohexane-1,2-dione acylhydrolase (decyclizing) [Lichenihabitans sp. Uapishka_5]|uniref:3D-(3,5/4)-trihydroxycyclohexane-1,2-dione acylhydrolase (decyclizing) n=1 Tax=Lichenihabitans sp. Uapishka_5 TaxID=3037302 RepID=UPI0029E81190|nr:3D-(3,5/4)-trihydroxycyclohexane-1,2-dione acylhydrolase (decyclizing) [Lichenihabitans sp. Uapishka_5]MDX7951574.1 3D-(3,5/4)-trihydroxycyclohexane-1,2-dione acylhydrolase (decyclizing) [Lichenihabitans sp. Uapishka_5]
MGTIRLTAAQAMVKYLGQQMTDIDGETMPLFAGIWAIFGHGNVSGMGEALYGARDTFPTFRAHNEQAMAHSAIAFAKASRRRRMMACTTSIGPGATNLVTACALAHVNRLPVLLIPGDVFANRRPDPVLQQVEAFHDGTVSASDCFRPVSRYFDRITRPEQVMPALERALQVLTDPAECGPATLSFCQDVQAEAYDYPERFFEPRMRRIRRPPPDPVELAEAVAALRGARRPVLVAGGGVLYSAAEPELARFAERHGLPVLETQAGKSALPDPHPNCMGAVGCTGTGASNALAAEADVVLAVGTRLADFTTGSATLIGNPDATVVMLNVQSFDLGKFGALPLMADAKVGLAALSAALGDHAAPADWTARMGHEKARWAEVASTYTAPTNAALPSDAQVIGAVQRAGQPSDVVVCAAGGLPGELHRLWKTGDALGYHIEYGYSCMGYEIAGGLGVKMALPHREVIVMVGDGSYLMLNSEIATSVMLGLKLTIVLLDNGGYGCINRLQQECGGAPFNNMLADSRHVTLPAIDFVAHARSLGAEARKVANLGELEAAFAEARAASVTQVILIDTDAGPSTEAGGFWWDVAVPQVSVRPEVEKAYEGYERQRGLQRAVN